MRQPARLLWRTMLLALLLAALTAVAWGLESPKITVLTNVPSGVFVKWNSGAWEGGYCVLRKTDGGAWTIVGAAKGQTWVDTRVQSGRRYTYTVRYRTAQGRPTGAFDRTGKKIVYLAPPKVSRAENVDGGVRLSWDRVQGAAKYRVFRRNGGAWKPLGDTDQTVFTDRSAQSGRSCRYTVRCITADGRQYTSGFDTAGTAAAYYAAPDLTCASNCQIGILVRWGQVDGVSSYRVYRRTGKEGWRAMAFVRGTAWTDRNTQSGQQYTYMVRCATEDGKHLLSSYHRKGITALRLTVPELVSARQTPWEANLRWRAVPGAAGYTVYRKTPGGSWTMLGRTTRLAYTDTTVSKNTDYIYTVRANAGRSVSDYDRTGLPATRYDPLPSALKGMDTARKTDQILLVIDHDLTLWNRVGGTWKKAMDVYCGYGRNGLRLASSRRQGDETTPIGAFPIPFAFGLGEDPGTLLPYRQITERSYWSAQRSTYNQWVESSTRVSGEHLIDIYQYKYAMVIGFNMDPVVYRRGSGIFLHCKSRDHWDTAGCVSVTEGNMLRFMRLVKPGAYIVIVPDAASLKDY